MKIPFGEGFCNSYDHKSVPLGVQSLFSLGLVSEHKAVFAHSDFLFPFTKGFMQMAKVYASSGKSLISNCPASSVTAKKGCSITKMYARIQR